jgi:hypothetical protein
MRNGFPVTSESASAVRNICPPPSPNDPSIVNMVLQQACFFFLGVFASLCGLCAK